MTMKAVARYMSIVLHPFVTALVLVFGAELRHGSAQAFRTVAIVAVLTIVPLAIFMVRQVQRGSWDNVDASNRTERPALFAVGSGVVAVLIGFSVIVRPESSMARGAIGVLLMLALSAIATRWVKVSLHMAFGMLAATTLLLLGSPAGWYLLPTMPLLAWARLILKRHTAGEVLLGSLVGAVFGYGIVRL